VSTVLTHGQRARDVGHPCRGRIDSALDAVRARLRRLPVLVCIYDDRADALDAVKIAVLSIRAHEPDLPVSVGLATASSETEEWFQARGVALTVGQDFGARGWDVKPASS
jgi:hypothetical protein